MYYDHSYSALHCNLSNRGIYTYMYNVRIQVVCLQRCTNMWFLCLLPKVVELWLKDRECQRSWQMLVDTVEHHAGGNNPSLARRIAEQHSASGEAVIHT